jgi:hypothetical protein
MVSITEKSHLTAKFRTIARTKNARPKGRAFRREKERVALGELEADCSPQNFWTVRLTSAFWQRVREREAVPGEVL